MAELYTDVTLPSAESIRLLRIEPLQDGKLKCRLKAYQLAELPRYFALSYTWRSPLNLSTDPSHNVQVDHQCEIECNGRPFQVLENLHSALVRISQVESLQGQNIWADAICINQDDWTERAEQVKMMATIFSLAESVVVWLGPGDEHTSRAAELIQWLSRLDKVERLSIHPRSLVDPVVQQILGRKYHQIEYWRALARLFCRAWFRRAWAIQEVLVAEKLVVLCGEHDLSWDNLVLVSSFLVRTAWSKELATPKMFAVDKTIDGVEVNDRYRVKPHLNGPVKLNAAKKTLVSNSTRDDMLLLSLIRSRRYYSLYPIDKAFSLYGIAKKYARRPELVPEPNYSWTEGKAYFETALAVLKGSNDLLLLAYPEGQVFRSNLMAGWPSWVPDWSVTDVVGLGITGYRRFPAGTNRERVLDFRENERVLGIEAAELDTVTDVGESKREVTRSHCFPQWLDIILSLDELYFTGESRMDVFWRSLITDTCKCEPSPHHPAQQKHRADFRLWFLETVRIGQTSQDKAFTERLSRLREVDALGLTPSEMEVSNAAGDSENSHAGENDGCFETLFSHGLCLKLFRTKKGFLGLGTESIMSGDSVWVVSGSAVPLILRSKPNSPDGRFELVGATYLHGFMHGEALNGKDLVFQPIEIG